MSNYTTQVRYICESVSGFTPSELLEKTVDEIISASREKVFNFDFPVYDEAFRPVIESTILLHFYTREIGAETVGLWQLYLCRKLREKMPYYNKLFESALIEFNPLYDTDYNRTHEGNSAGNKSGNNSRNVTGTAARNATGNRTTNTTEGRMGTETTANSGTQQEVNDGETATSNTNRQTDTTESSTSKTGNRTGSKTTHDEHTRENDHRDYYSDTPMTKVEGVNGMPVMTGDTTLGYNYYLTNYRRIKDNETGENDGTESQTENTTETGTGESETVSNGTASGTGTTHSTKAVSTSDSGNKNTTDNLTGQETDATTDTSNETTTNAEMGSNSETYNNTDAYVEHIYGKMGNASYSSMILEYRETIVNYMEMLLNDLEPLFMNIW